MKCLGSILLSADDFLWNDRIQMRYGIRAKDIQAAIAESVPVGITIGILLDCLEDGVPVFH